MTGLDNANAAIENFLVISIIIFLYTGGHTNLGF